jgi:hypothetical protein
MRGMKLALSVMFGVLLAASASFGQSSFKVGGNILGLVSGSTKMVAADASSDIKVGSMFTIRTDSVIVSAAATQANLASFNLAGIKQKLPADSLFTKIGLDPKGYEVYGIGQAGTVTNAAGTSKAFSGGVGLDKFTSAVTINLFEFRWFHGSIPTGDNPDGSPIYQTNTWGIKFGVTF